MIATPAEVSVWMTYFRIVAKRDATGQDWMYRAEWEGGVNHGRAATPWRISRDAVRLSMVSRYADIFEVRGERP
jgi:hypothetical protein